MRQIYQLTRVSFRAMVGLSMSCAATANQALADKFDACISDVCFNSVVTDDASVSSFSSANADDLKHGNGLSPNTSINAAEAVKTTRAVDNFFSNISSDAPAPVNPSTAFTKNTKILAPEIMRSNSKVPSGTTERHGFECGPSPLTPAQIRQLVIETARRHKVDVDLATAIAWAESHFDRRRNSPKGARGPMQLMPETAARFGVENICDPAQNIEGAVKYLRVLQDEFQNPFLVAAAYNGGERRIYQYAGVPPFPETVRYVAKVVNYQLGLTMPSPKPGNNPDSTSRHAIEDANPSTDVGVITVQKSGRFVGGVMHF